MFTCRSSRSHAVVSFQLVEEGHCIAKLFVVDMAGSERLKESGAEGAVQQVQREEVPGIQGYSILLFACLLFQ